MFDNTVRRVAFSHQTIWTANLNTHPNSLFALQMPTKATKLCDTQSRPSGKSDLRDAFLIRDGVGFISLKARL